MSKSKYNSFDIELAKVNEPPKSVQEFKKEQQDLHKQQDAILDNMSTRLDHLKHISVAMGTEIKDQGRILDHVEQDIDMAQGKVDNANAMMTKIMKKIKSSCNMCYVLIGLVVILTILFLVYFLTDI